MRKTVDDFLLINCALCNRDETIRDNTIEWRNEILQYHICSYCGLKYLNPQPSNAWYELFYKTEFWNKEKDFKRGKKKRIVEKSNKHLDWRINKAKEKAFYTDILINKTLKINDSTRILDIGAGLGEISGLLKQKYNCDPEIIEPSDFASQRAFELYKLQRIAISIDTFEVTNELTAKYDLIISNFSFDNLTDPLGALCKISKLLANNGIFFLRTRNQYYRDSSNPYHPYLYFPETLMQFINKSGMHIVKTVSEPHPSKNILPNDSTHTIFCKKSHLENYQIKPFDIQRAVHYRDVGRDMFDKARVLKNKNRFLYGYYTLVKQFYTLKDPGLTYNI